MNFEYQYAAEEAVGILAGLISGLPAALLNIASYVLTALALYTIAKNRGIGKPWLAWLPVVDVWLIGSISDQYRYVVKGEVRSKRKVLLVLRIVMAALILAIIACAIASGVAIVMGGPGEMGALVLIISSMALLLSGVSIAFAVVFFMALYDVYTSMDPDTSALFLVLSILIPVTKPFFLFFCRNKESGMPPRRPEPASYTPPREPWEQEDRDYL